MFVCVCVCLIEWDRPFMSVYSIFNQFKSSDEICLKEKMQHR